MSQQPTSNTNKSLRIHMKYYRLIFTGMMGLIMSFLISTILMYINKGWFESFFSELLSSWGTAFVIAWPCAYISAYMIQEHLLSRIHFYKDD